MIATAAAGIVLVILVGLAEVVVEAAAAVAVVVVVGSSVSFIVCCCLTGAVMDLEMSRSGEILTVAAGNQVSSGINNKNSSSMHLSNDFLPLSGELLQRHDTGSPQHTQHAHALP